MELRILLLVGTGGFIGSVLRYVLTHLIQNKFFTPFPLGTLVVNLLGCLVIGFVFAMFDKGSINIEWRFFLATGICGGFTTFSAFSNETVALLRNGQNLYAFSYIAASVILGLLATWLAITVYKLL